LVSDTEETYESHLQCQSRSVTSYMHRHVTDMKVQICCQCQ